MKARAIDDVIYSQCDGLWCEDTNGTGHVQARCLTVHPDLTEY